MSQTARTNPGYLKQKLATHFFFFSSEFVFFNQIAKETHFFSFFFFWTDKSLALSITSRIIGRNLNNVGMMKIIVH